MPHHAIENVTFAVQGESITDDYPTNRPLTSVVNHLLGQTHQRPTDVKKWGLFTEEGAEIDLDQTIGEAGIKPGQTVHLRIKTPGAHA